MKNLIFFFALLISYSSYGQDSGKSTALPFLNINTNARIGALGEIGVVSSSFYKDAGVFQNPALLSKHGRYAGISYTHMAWLENVADMSLTEYNAFYSFSSKSTIAYSFKKIDQDKIYNVDEQGNILNTTDPIEYYHQITFAHTINKHLSFGAGIKYIKSDLGEEMELKPVNTFAIDLGAEYDRTFAMLEKSKINLHAGMALNNFGPKVEYSDAPDAEKMAIPSKLGIGALVNPDFHLSEKMRLNVDLALQIEKPLLPSDYAGREQIQKLGSELRLNYEDIFYVALRAGKYKSAVSNGHEFNTSGFGLGIYGFVLDYKKIKSESKAIDGTTAFTFAYRTSLEKLFRF